MYNHKPVNRVVGIIMKRLLFFLDFEDKEKTT